MPDYRDVRVNVALTGFVRNYKFENVQFMADVVAPPVPVKSTVGTYKTLGRELLSSQVSDAAGPDGKLNVIGYEMGSDTYECEGYGFKTLVTEKVIRDAPQGFDPMRQAGVMLKHALLLRKELRIVTLAEAAGAAYRSTPTNDWDHADATIVSDVNAGKTEMEANMGGWGATHWLFGKHIGNEIVNQASLSTIIVASAALQKPLDLLNLAFTADDLPPRLMGMQRLMPNVNHNIANTDATESLANVWGDHSYLFYLDPTPDSATWARQFRMTDIVIRQWKENDPPGWWVAAEWEVDEVQTTPAALWKFIDVT